MSTAKDYYLAEGCWLQVSGFSFQINFTVFQEVKLHKDKKTITFLKQSCYSTE